MPRSLPDAIKAVRENPTATPAGAADTAVVAAASLPCFGPFTVQSSSGVYVSTELAYTGSDTAMLRARAPSVGSWEQYDICFDDADGTIALRSRANNLIVSAELGYTGSRANMLRARASSVGPWEQFFWVISSDGYDVPLSAANGLYVSAGFGDTGNLHGMLRARAGAIGSWEKFIIN